MKLSEAGRETLIGTCVMVVGCIVLALSYGGGGGPSRPGYDLVARFNKAEGVVVGSDVRLSGMSVGTVTAQALDERYRAVLTLRVTSGTHLPSDSAALIQTDGLLGTKFVALQPGGEDALLKDGDEFKYTQDSISLESILSLIVAQAEMQRASGSKKE
jgi:phospholipid/cholesterol/gamma-HCH transport system substrate-binding protein